MKERVFVRSNDNNKPRTIYGLVDPRDGLIYYVGVTVDLMRRLQDYNRRKCHNADLVAWLTELHELGVRPIVRIYGSIADDYIATQREAELIRKFYIEGHPLVNRNSIYKKNRLTYIIQEEISNYQP